MPTNHRLILSSIALAIASVVAACGGQDDGTTTPVATTPQLTVAADWNLVSVQAWTQLEANPDAVLSPHQEARSLAMANAVIHDVLNAIDARYAPYAYMASQPGASPDAAVAQAAHDVLVGDPQMGATYPSGSEVPFLDAALATDLAKVADGTAKTAGIALGKAAALYYIQLRAADAAHMTPFGPTRQGNGTQPGQYQYTAPFNSPGDPFFGGAISMPDWQNVTPFVLRTTTQFSAPGPDDPASSAFAADLAAVKALGATTGSTRTADQSVAGMFWAETPTLMWNRIARSAFTTKNLNGWDRARGYALLNLALADTYIVYAEVGDQFNFWRPVTAIHYLDPSSTWQEFGFPTPPTRDYTSGHAMEGGAASAVLRTTLGTDAIAFSTTSTSSPGVTRSFTTFTQAADENAMSRVWLGYHFPKSTTDGKALGTSIGQYVATTALAPKH